MSGERFEVRAARLNEVSRALRVSWAGPNDLAGESAFGLQRAPSTLPRPQLFYFASTGNKTDNVIPAELRRWIVYSLRTLDVTDFYMQESSQAVIK